MNNFSSYIALLALCAVAPTSYAASPQDADAESAPLAETVRVSAGRAHHLTAPWRVKGVSLTQPLIADVEVLTPEMLVVTGKAPGVTDMIMWNEAGESRTLAIEVSLDLAPMERQMVQMFPGADLSLANTQNVLVASGSLATAGQAEQLNAYLQALGVDYVDMTNLPGIQQVQVQVRIAEVSRTAIRALGINGFWTGSDGFVGSTIGSSTGGAINPVSIGLEKGTSAGSNLPFSFTNDVGVGPAVTLFGGLANADLELFFQALEENQYLRILAEPNLVALSGHEASFLAGGEFPIPVVQGGGAGSGTSITIEYKEFGVGLRFRPLVLGDGGIRLAVASEVSELTELGAVEIQGFSVPSVFTRRTDTTIELKSGQSFAMAGLISESTNAQVARTPLLGDLPILGALFRSVRYKTGETELLVMVTASLVEPLSAEHMLPMPGDDHIAPSDWELYCRGRIEGDAPPPLAARDAAWFKNLGLGELRGPGAWASHDDGPEISRADTGNSDSPEDSTGDE